MDYKKNFLLALIPLVPSLVALMRIDNTDSLRILSRSLVIAFVGFVLTDLSIPTVSSYTQKAGLFGKDLGKKGSPSEDKEM